MQRRNLQAQNVVSWKCRLQRLNLADSIGIAALAPVHHGQQDLRIVLCAIALLRGALDQLQTFLLIPDQACEEKDEFHSSRQAAEYEVVDSRHQIAVVIARIDLDQAR